MLSAKCVSPPPRPIISIQNQMERATAKLTMKNREKNKIIQKAFNREHTTHNLDIHTYI